MSNTYSISVETGGYRQLDLFAERCGEGNAVVTVADGNGVAIAAHTMPIAERRHHFSIAVPQKSTVTVAASGLVVRFGYLSECDDLLDNGVRYVNMNPSDTDWPAQPTLEQIYNRFGRSGAHFEPFARWMNDPNGLCQFQGRYHLFFQLNPYGFGWDNMHWGHAVSRDLVHWTHLPVFLEPQPELHTDERIVGGAFSGAKSEGKGGFFEAADSGTIFLDEIGEMAFDLQAKLLRVLESGEFIKVGDTRPIKVNVRIIAATNRDLQKEIEAGHFREDLYYRLSVFRIQLPPLRERIEDIELYVRAFVKMFGPGVGKKIEAITPEYLGTLKKHVWKGNVRELRNVIERSRIIADGAVLTVSDLPFDIQQSVLESEGGKGYSEFDLAQGEKAHIRKVLQYTGGNKTEAARLMHIGLTPLYRKIEEYGIR